MTDLISITGLVATTPRHVQTTAGLDVTSFRLASTQRRFDRAENRWVDGDTNWFTISAFRHLAVNVSNCVEKGHRVVVTGRLKVRDWTHGEKTGTTVEVEADAVGQDLAWGTSVYTRSPRAAAPNPDADGSTGAPDGTVPGDPDEAVPDAERDAAVTPF